MALVSRGECSGVWLSDFNYLCLAGAESAVGLRLYFGGGFCASAVGGLVVVEGASDGDTAWRSNFYGCRISDATDGSSINLGVSKPWGQRSEFGILERADGEGDGGKKKGGSCEANGEEAFVVISGATSGSSLE